MTYIDTPPDAADVGHSWREHTRFQLTWLYGESEGLRRLNGVDARAAADVAAWNALGRRSAA